MYSVSIFGLEMPRFGSFDSPSLFLSSLGKRPGGRKQAVSALAEQRPKTGPKPPGGAGMLSLPAGGHTAAHTAKQGENAQEDNGIENSFFFVLHIKS